MTTNAQTIEELMALGFDRAALARIAKTSVHKIREVKLDNASLLPNATFLLHGLLRWVQSMKKYREFTYNPVPYYEMQMVILEINGEKQYTFLHTLYEQEVISAREMEALALQAKEFYDYSAFSEEYPMEYYVATGDDELSLICHHGMKEVDLTCRNRLAIRRAVRQLLKGRDNELCRLSG